MDDNGNRYVLFQDIVDNFTDGVEVTKDEAFFVSQSGGQIIKERKGRKLSFFERVVEPREKKLRT